MGIKAQAVSASIRVHYDFTRRMGAVARDLLEQAAANEWNVKKIRSQSTESFRCSRAFWKRIKLCAACC